MNTLIIVPGHASFKDIVEGVPEDFQKDRYWALQEFQKGEPPYYVEHIKAGAQLAEETTSSLLMFSGGRTRAESEKWSEAATYKAIYEKLELSAHQTTVVELEEFAKDSFENIQFSIYAFYRKIGRYPAQIVVVGWKFKQERFELHARTLGIPPDQFRYVGVNTPKDITSALRGEEKALASFVLDPFGNNGPLREKRLERNPFHDTHPYDGLPPIVIG
ncbi:MAG: hypothetical protein WBO49_00315 [Candidatus Saccharimonas sp.]